MSISHRFALTYRGRDYTLCETAKSYCDVLSLRAMNYQFDREHISQHVVKYGVDVRPAIVPDREKTKLQDYCNWLIEQFPQAFEILVAGPKQLLVQKNFVLPSKRIDMPTFVLTPRGPVFTLPQRLYIDEVQDIDIPDKGRIFRKALDELRSRFADRQVPRVGVIHEFVFDTGDIDSVQILASNLKNDVWRERITSLRILLEAPTEGKNVNVELRPTYLRAAQPGAGAVPSGGMGFGIMVNVDINNQQVKGDLTNSEVRDIVAFANDYIPDELIRFLNNEY